MHRRTFLQGAAGLAGAATLAGCGALGGGPRAGPVGASNLAAEAPTASFRMEPIDDAGIAERVTYGVDPASAGEGRVDLTPAIDGGSVAVEATSAPMPEDRPVVHDGGVYEFSHEVVDSTPATSFHVVLDVVQGTPEASETVAFADLPAVDRAVFRGRGWDEDPIVGIGTSVLYRDDRIEASALVPDPEYTWIEWDGGTRGRWEVRGSNATSVKTFEYRATAVAESAAAYGADVREAHAFALEELSAAEGAIVETAVESEEGFAVGPDATPTPAARTLLKRFQPRDTVEFAWDDEDGTGTVAGRYLVRRDGTVYWTQVAFYDPDDGASGTTGTASDEEGDAVGPPNSSDATGAGTATRTIE